MSRVFVIRHGQTDWNIGGLLQGSSDIPLNDVGREQAARAAEVLAPLLGEGALVVSSPLERALNTAVAVADRLGVSVAPDERLVERGFGIWEGTTVPEREKRWPAEMAIWATRGHPDIEGLERDEAVRDRVVAAVQDWAGRVRADGVNVALVSHGSASRLGMMGLLGMSLEARPLAGLGNTAWSVLSRSGDAGSAVPRSPVTGSAGQASWVLEQHNVSVEVLAS